MMRTDEQIAEWIDDHPGQYRHADVSSANMREDLRARNAKAYAALAAWRIAHGNLWIMGKHGSGKTFAAHCLLTHYLRRGISVAEITGIEFEAQARRQYEWLDRLDVYTRVGLLLLDDLDKGDWTRHGMTALHWLIDRRWDANAIIIVTSNWTPAEFIQRVSVARPDNATLGVAMFDRLSWPGRRCTPITFTGPSVRQENTAGTNQEG